VVPPNVMRMSCGQGRRGRATARPADASPPAHKSNTTLLASARQLHALVRQRVGEAYVFVLGRTR